VAHNRHKAIERDLIGWAWGAERLLGTNPIAVGFPGRLEPPIVIDMATSAVAYGKVEMARRKGSPIPSGWAINSEGVITLKPDEIIKGGALLPLDSESRTRPTQGVLLGIMVDMLSCVLSF